MAESTADTQQQQYPILDPYAAKDRVVSGSKSAMSSIANSQTMQSLQNGPMAEKARQEMNQTQNEFGNLAAARTTPATQTATGQNLTHYHSFFYSLLSWENPRATAISYASLVLIIFACRYVPIVRYALRATWIVLGVTAAAELAGRMVLDQGLTSKFRPKKYYTIPRETLDSFLEDAEQLINFFVIEFQRILFAENLYATIGAFFTTLLTYFLIKITPAWGLALLFSTLIYFVPLIYITNKDLIDEHLNNATKLVNDQTQQLRNIASQHTSKAMEMGSNTFKDYSAKAQEMIGQTKNKAVEKGVVSPDTANKAEEQLKGAPSAPSTEPAGQASHAEPIPAQ